LRDLALSDSEFSIRLRALSFHCLSIPSMVHKNAQLSLTNSRDAKPCGKVLQFDV